MRDSKAVPLSGAEGLLRFRINSSTDPYRPGMVTSTHGPHRNDASIDTWVNKLDESPPFPILMDEPENG